MSGESPAPRWRRLPALAAEGVQSLALALLGGFMLLAASEGLMRLLGGAPDADRMDRFVQSSEYAPWTQFRVPDSEGRVTSTEGRRRTVADGFPNAAVDPTAGAIWMFGGSTTFGWNVADHETLPSQLAALLAQAGGPLPEVVNFGQPYFWSMQEGVLFHTLLIDRSPPRVAIFLDGLNDVLQESSSYHREPFWTPQVAARLDGGGAVNEICRASRLCRFAKNTLRSPRRAEALGHGDASSSYDAPPGVDRDELADRLVATYLRHVELTGAICRRFEVRCLFAIQPVPFFRYDRSQDAVADSRDFPLFDRVYPRLEEAAESRAELLFLSDELQGFEGRAPFVDGFHYSRDFHRHLAGRLLEHLGEDTAASGAAP